MERLLLDIGGVRLDVGLDPPLATMTRRAYHGFLVDPGATEPWRVDIAFDQELVIADRDGSLQLDRSQPVWVMTSRAFRMMVDPAARVIVARLTQRHGPLRDELPLRVHLALKAAVTLIASNDGALVMHASAVLLGGQALAFLGPSGAGKSTIARQLESAAGASVIADDVVVARLVGDGLELAATPFAGIHASGCSRATGPWRRAFTLARAAPGVGTQPVARAVGYRALVRSLLAPQGDPPLEAELLRRADVAFAHLAWAEIAFDLDASRTAAMLREHQQLRDGAP